MDKQDMANELKNIKDKLKEFIKKDKILTREFNKNHYEILEIINDWSY